MRLLIRWQKIELKEQCNNLLYIDYPELVKGFQIIIKGNRLNKIC